MDTVNVIVEIPRFSQNKYEYDHETDTIKLDRHLLVAMGYPAEYGFIPDTLGGDGDPLDVLVITEFPTFPGCLIESKILGMCIMTDENGRDEKLIAVPSYDKNWKSADRHHRRARARFSIVFATFLRSTRTLTRASGSRSKTTPDATRR